MNELARATLGRLEKETGAAFDLVKDFGPVSAFVEAAQAALNPPPAPATVAALMPCKRVGNVTLWRLSYGAKYFFDEEILARWGYENPLSELGFAYCMAHAREPSKIWTLAGDPEAIEKALKDWSKTIDVPADCLIAAMDSLQDSVGALYATPAEICKECGQPIFKDDTGAEKDDLGKYVAELARQTGRTVENLIWETTQEELILLLSQQPTTESGAPDPYDPKIQALKKFYDEQANLKAILLARASENNEGEI